MSRNLKVLQSVFNVAARRVQIGAVIFKGVVVYGDERSATVPQLAVENLAVSKVGAKKNEEDKKKTIK